ncbi:MAG: PDZ domain-containing protein [Candidatus Jettenia sp.]|uniref:Peptidase n=1 Tax=Candidatus Jettenia caeni TaxID=247490 RepID=I3IJQ0_9BACT|nr:MXAN_5808 family serine peptidase [Candidatus Jettenia sp. AMX1]MBC6928838.1 PDZ domain-containing protein [Candidatus Jettenia sp.]WKZ17212.1 MAG: MXAN_5808 family serine peptidase [Candidatus Jettenia caeni]KAA0250550.1 MAG: PDZ domain-containing protein [Candidatus Jettenia sp. AMX1]MCE7881037.1 PDZ domain-containing protein [Candidatus Jettenia sp. AMX1]MCQ3927932.1 PDZ domain-containing protein [Candidatus Jettenia sp.]
MRLKFSSKYLLATLLFLFSITCFFFTFSKTFGLEPYFEKQKEKEDSNYKFRLSGIVMSYINRLYVDPERIKSLEMLKEALAWEEKVIPEVLTNFEENTVTETITVDDISKTYDLSKIRRSKDMVEILRDALSFINKYRQTDGNLTASDIEYTAINGMLTQLDPHSVILPPKEFNEFKIGTTGKFGGLGMVVGLREGQLTVISPIEGTPAARSGIKAGDKIIEIDGESTINMNLTESVGKLRGDPETEVTLSVLTEKAAQPKLYTLEREIIAIPTVESAPVDNEIGYIKIRNFQDDTSQSLSEHLKRLKTSHNNKMKGLIIDLRNNSGGLLDQAIEVADKFLDSGAIVVTVGPSGHPREAQDARKTETDEAFYPIVVLVDAGSASGAEIVAGALKENNRAVIVGDRSFGKGSVQQLIELMDGSALKLTIAKYLTPLLTDIQSVGITPDIQLIPATVSKDNVNLFRGLTVLREEDLKQHLEEHPKGETSYATLKYFLETTEKKKIHEIEPEEPEELDDPYKLPDFNKDFHVLFARKLLARASEWERETFLKNSLPIVEETARLEEEKIAQALQKLDIDWSKGTSSGVAKSNVTFSTAPSNGQVKAGDKITLTVNVTNTGEAPLYQLHGISSSKNGLFDKLEFIFGKIDKGITKSYTTTIDVPKNSLDRKDEIVIKFEELNQHNPQDIKLNIVTEALPRPLFAYSYQILDHEKDASVNNGDGLIQTGEDIDLFVWVKNIGEGPSEKNVVTLRDLSNKEVLIKNGRVEIGALNPGEKKEVKLSLFVKETIPSGNFSVDLIISDMIFGTFLSNKLNLPIIGSKSKITPVTTNLKIKKNHTPLYGGMSFDSPVLSVIKEGTVLVSDAKNNEWLRIKLPDGRYGWLSVKDAAELNGKENKPGNLDPFIQRTPPIITLNKSLSNLLFGNDQLPISVAIEDDIQVKHAYILVNNDKVFFKSNRNATPKEQIRLEIAKDVPLKEGPNVITIVARDNQDLITTKSFVATRSITVAKGL